MKNTLTKLILCCLLLSATIATNAATLVVQNGDNSGAGSLRAVIASAKDGDIITFASSVNTVTLSSEISTDKIELTIDGGTGVTIMRSKNTSHCRLLNFTFPSNRMVTLRGITFKNGNLDGKYYMDYDHPGDDPKLSASGDGGAVWANCPIMVENCTFIDNAVLGNGGALWVKGSLTLKNCDFLSNFAKNIFEDEIAGCGGAVYCENLVTMTNCSFSNNSAIAFENIVIYPEYITFDDSASELNGTTIFYIGGSGGAIYSANWPVTLTGCTFNDNTAGKQGGGVYTGSLYSLTNSLTDCTFSGNTAKIGGGGIYCKSSINLKGCSFFGNKTTKIDGGGVWAGNGSANSTDCLFSGNTALGKKTLFVGYNGGGLYAKEGIMRNCNFSKNQSSENGGGVYLINNGTDHNNTGLYDCTFDNNSAESNGGAVYGFENLGGTYVSDCIFTNNRSNSGAAIYTPREGRLRITNCAFASNTGNSIISVQFSLHTNNLRVINSTFVQNNLDGKGKIADTSAAYWYHCTFSDNRSTSIVGGERTCISKVNSNVFPFFENCLILLGPNQKVTGFEDQTIGTYSSNIIIESKDVFALISSHNLYFGDNQLTGNYLSPLPGKANGATRITDYETDVLGNTRPSGNGKCNYGAVETTAIGYLVTNSENSGPGSLRQCIIDAEKASGTDKIVVCFDSKVSSFNINLSTPISFSKAITIMGRLNNDGTPAITINGNASSNVFNYTGTSTATFYGLAINKGTSVNGGGGIKSSGPIKVDYCSFTDNKSTDYSDYGGGAIYASGTNTVITNCKFNSNGSNCYGGAVHAGSNGISLTDCNFTGNSSSIRGGAVYAPTGISVTNCQFNNNTTVYYGGAVAARNASITGSTFSGNKGDEGGGFNELGGFSWLNRCVFYNNTGKKGGAICANDANATFVLTNSTLSGNTGVDGYDNTGAIYNRSTSYLLHNTITNNKGGGIYAYSGTASYLYNNIVIGNTNTTGGLLQLSGLAIDYTTGKNLIEGQDIPGSSPAMKVTSIHVFGPNTFNPVTGLHLLLDHNDIVKSTFVTSNDLNSNPGLTPADINEIISRLGVDQIGDTRSDIYGLTYYGSVSKRETLLQEVKTILKAGFKFDYDVDEVINFSNIDLELRYVNGVCQTINSTAPGVTNNGEGITATSGYKVLKFIYLEKECGLQIAVGIKQIESVDLHIAAPVADYAPSTSPSSTDSPRNYDIGTATWTPNDALFQLNVPYTVSTTLTAHDGYVFTDRTIALFNDKNANCTLSETGKQLTVTYTFPIPCDVYVSANPSTVFYKDNITLKANVSPGWSGNPTGTVEFIDQLSGVSIGIAPLLNGEATLNISTLSIGTYLIIGNYSGDEQYTMGKDTHRALIVVESIFNGGDGTKNNPYLIATAAALDFVRDNPAAHYKLVNDINLTPYLSLYGAGFSQWGSSGWLPIGNLAERFTGSFKGAGHKITGLWINRSETDLNGLFGITRNADIDSLGVEIANAGILGGAYTGGLIGATYSGSINNCYVAGGSIFGQGETGGLVGTGSNGTSIKNCYTLCDVTGSNAVGGLVGKCSDNYTISNCYATGSINGDYTVGGIVGLAGDYTSIVNNVAANAGISGLDGRTNRIAGAFSTNPYAATGFYNNYANSVMSITVNGSKETRANDTKGNGTGKTLAELPTFGFYDTASNWLNYDIWSKWSIAAGEDHTKIWRICDGATLPFFQWQPFTSCPSVPVITLTVQPDIMTTVDEGNINHSLTVGASVTEGATLNYEWFSNTTNDLSTGTAKSTGVNSASFPIPNELTIGSYYYYCVVSALGAEPQISDLATVIVMSAPGTPQTLTLTVSDMQIVASWTAPASDGGNPLTGYEIQINDNPVISKLPTELTHTFTSLTNGTTYTVKVWAINSKGSSATPAEATATPSSDHPTYGLSIGTFANGSVTSGKLAYEAGEEVTLTLENISQGYELSSIAVTKNSDNSIVIFDSGSGKNNSATYTFTMPGEGVTVTAIFGKNADQTDVEAAISLIEAMTGIVVDQATANTRNTVATWLVEQINTLLSDNGINITVSATDISVGSVFTAATRGTVSNAAGSNGSFTFTVTLKKSNSTTLSTAAPLNGVITATPYDAIEADNNDIAAALMLVKGATYTDTQANVTNIAQAKTSVETIIGTLALNGVTAVVNDITFTPATAGTASNQSGASGSYEFTVTLSKGTGTPQTTSTLTLTITPTVYDTTEDNIAITVAKAAIEGAIYIDTQVNVPDIAAARAVVSAIIGNLSIMSGGAPLGSGLTWNGVTFTINDGTFTTATEGSTVSPSGTDGSYTFTVNLTKGGGTPQTTDLRTLTITATPYDTSYDDADIAAALALIEATIFKAQQANVPDIAAAKATVEAILSTLNLNGVSAVVNDDSFTAAIAGAYGIPGTEGSYDFTVTLSKGGGTPQTTAPLTLTITATPYVGTGFYRVTIGTTMFGTITAVTDYIDLTTPSGSSVTLIIAPAQGYKLLSIAAYETGVPANIVTLGGTGVVFGSTRTFNMPAFDVTIEATFEKTDERLAIEAALALIEGMTGVTVDRVTANDETDVTAWLVTQINELLAANSSDIRVSDTDITLGSGFTAAEDGTSANPLGTTGSFNFIVTLQDGSGATLTTAVKNGVITKTPYNPADDDAAITAVKAAIEGATYTDTQANVPTLADARTSVQAMIAGLGLSGTMEGSIDLGNVTQTLVDGVFTAATAGTAGNPSGINGSYTFTVTLDYGAGIRQTAGPLTLIITATHYDATNDDAAITAVKAAIEGASYTDTQVNVPDIAAARASVQDIIAGLGLSGTMEGSIDLGNVTQTLVDGVFTAATAGTPANLAGTNGSYTFTVKLNYGGGVEQITGTLTLTITATPYDPTADNAAITAAKALIEATPYNAIQANVSNAAQAKTAVEAIISGLSLNGVTTVVNGGTFTAAIAGTAGNPSGTNGSYTFKVTLSRGGGTPQTTITLTLNITATPYTAPSTYSVTVGATTNGSVTASPSSSVTSGTTVRLTVTIASGYELNAITAYRTGDASTDVVLTGSGVIYSFTMPAYDVTVSATFSKTADQIDVETALSLVEAISGVTVAQSVANTTSEVRTWLANYINSLTGMSATGITVTASDITLGSGFTAATAGTSASPNGRNGSFTFTVSLQKGSSATLTTASRNGVITATPYTSTVKYSVTVNPTANGSIAVSPSGQVAEGTAVTLTITPATGYELETVSAYRTVAPSTIVALTGSGSGSTVRTFTMPAYDVTVTATFRKTQAQLDKEAVEALKAAIEGGTFRVAQATANDAASIKTWLTNTLNLLFGQSGNLQLRSAASLTGTVNQPDGLQFRSATSITGTVTVTSVTAAIAGTEAVPNGVNGAFTFTVNLTCGATTLTTNATSGVIVATPYSLTSVKRIELLYFGDLSALILNTGNVATGDLTLALSGTNADVFTLPIATVSSLTVGDEAEVTLVPSAGLAAGTYTATLTVSGSDLTSVQTTITYTVTFTGNEDIATVALKAWTHNGHLHVSGLISGEQWSVCNLSGMIIYRNTAKDDKADIALPERGVYIIQSGNRTVKVVN